MQYSIPIRPQVAGSEGLAQLVQRTRRQGQFLRGQGGQLRLAILECGTAFLLQPGDHLTGIAR